MMESTSTDSATFTGLDPRRWWVPMLLVPAFGVGLIMAFARRTTEQARAERFTDRSHLVAQRELVAHIVRVRDRVGRCPLAESAPVTISLGAHLLDANVGRDATRPTARDLAVALGVAPNERRSVGGVPDLGSAIFFERLRYSTDGESFVVTGTLERPHRGSRRNAAGEHELDVRGSCARSGEVSAPGAR